MYQRILRALDALERGMWAEFDVYKCADLAENLWKHHKISTAEMYVVADRITEICENDIRRRRSAHV